ncbi:hypothetical protein PR048_017464 [Dryococelus australis]|uniref:Uncharacterized protein n=1 Tax=Dryococelus australis TaxID=614101 RepID=A0ABQ9H9S0_9NEOP|nr:hypothetical protein PR048_017464 [Dryococelus australis]
MENERQRNQRNRRRERAQRIQAQRESQANEGDSGDDEVPVREKPPRPLNRRKKLKELKEPLFLEDIVDGFSILAFRTYEDLQVSQVFVIVITVHCGVVANLYNKYPGRPPSRCQ